MLHKQLSKLPSTIQRILDSGSSGHFLHTNSPQQNVKEQQLPLQIKQPDRQKLLSKHKSELKIIPELSKKTRPLYTFEK